MSTITTTPQVDVKLWPMCLLGETKSNEQTKLLQLLIAPRMYTAHDICMSQEIDADETPYDAAADIKEYNNAQSEYLPDINNIYIKDEYIEYVGLSYYCYKCLQPMCFMRPRGSDPYQHLFNCCGTTFCQDCLSDIFQRPIDIKTEKANLDKCCPICVFPTTGISGLKVTPLTASKAE